MGESSGMYRDVIKTRWENFTGQKAVLGKSTGITEAAEHLLCATSA